MTATLHSLRTPARSNKSVSLAVFALAIAGGLLGLGNHWLRFGALFPQAAVEACEFSTTALPLLEMQPQEASKLCADEQVIIVDVRDAQAYAEGHIASAVHLPCSAALLEDAVRGRLATHPTLLVYGDGSKDAEPVARSLQAEGFLDVRLLAGGYPAWDKALLACAAGPCDSCQESHP